MEYFLDFVRQYVPVHGPPLFALGVVLIIVWSKFALPRIALHLGFLFVAVGLVSTHEAVCTMGIP
ncbi:MAG: hypothetical protein OXD31_10095 [Chloroflexi bacterium]|nr:hypothetical protein [Chloroflexota bacterium]